MSSPVPTNITANRQTRQAIIAWNDGHTSAYGFAFLRRACPCAECKGGHAQMGTLPGPEVYALPDEDTPATRLRRIEAVGTYAMMIEWEDGHSYGIYNWLSLRAMCPCPDCRQGSEHGR
jgi:DUF971 family protein